MYFCRCVLVGCLVSLLFKPFMAAGAPRIEVFTVAGVPVTHVPDRATVVELDLSARLDHRLSRDLPGQRQAAARIVLELSRRLTRSSRPSLDLSSALVAQPASALRGSVSR